ncbi:hypothetical protein [Streptacidiphilus albus]|uniref:hypothetical protein n=1 Tax=Streptacidiphilus albus TaxID=105425 RepID=UPI00128B5770|nr:hypothetical protein [Streptacidiphilus albus]
MVTDRASTWSLITSDVSQGAGALAILAVGVTAVICVTLVVLVLLTDKDKRLDVVGYLVPVLLALANRRRWPGSSADRAVAGELRDGDESADGPGHGS